MSHRMLMGVATLFLAASAPSTVAAQARPSHETEVYPVDGYAYNSCNNEFVHVTGTERIARTVVRNGTSTLSVFHINFSDTKGTGMTTGASYVLAAAELELLHADTPTWVSDYLLNEQLVGKGTAPNLGLHILQTFTFDGSHYSSETKRYDITCN